MSLLTIVVLVTVFFLVLAIAWYFFKPVLEDNLCLGGQVYYNECNGVIVLVKASDNRFDSYPGVGRRYGWIQYWGDHKVVQPSFVFYHSNAGSQRKDLMTGSFDDYLTITGHVLKSQDGSLFVPFVSEARMSFAEQEKLFPKKTMDEACKYFEVWRPGKKYTFNEKLRLAPSWILAHRWLLSLVTAVLWTSFCLSMVVGVGVLVNEDKRRDIEHPQMTTSFYRSSDGHLYAKQTPRGPKDFPAMLDGEREMNKLSRRVVGDDPISVGGGMVSFHIYNSNGQLDPEWGARGTEALHLKPGDQVILRDGQVLMANRVYQWERWVVTEEEAQALLQTGRFKFED